MMRREGLPYRYIADRKVNIQGIHFPIIERKNWKFAPRRLMVVSNVIQSW